MTEALVVGRLTAGFPLVLEIAALPDEFPATGFTRSFWDSDAEVDGRDDLKEAA